jgi:streptogramin lyase
VNGQRYSPFGSKTIAGRAATESLNCRWAALILGAKLVNPFRRIAGPWRRPNVSGFAPALGVLLAILTGPQPSAAQVFTEFPIPTAGAQPQAITAGPDGALWFYEGNNKIGRITTAGVISEFPVSNDITFMTSGPDGAVWFTEATASQIGRITTTGTVTEFPTPMPNSNPDGITAGPDGALWFTEPNLNRIGRFTTFLADIIFADGFDCP